jgi:hypothetical protein
MAVDPQMGVIADLQVQVGGLVRGSNAQQLVKIHKTSWGSSLLFIGSELILLEALAGETANGGLLEDVFPGPPYPTAVTG